MYFLLNVTTILFLLAFKADFGRISAFHVGLEKIHKASGTELVKTYIFVGLPEKKIDFSSKTQYC